jgi:hypothetical protein
MTGFKRPDLDAGAQTFLQGSINYFQEALMIELTGIDSPRFRVVQVCCIGPQRELVLEKQIVGRMMGPEKSHSECQKKQMAREAPNADLQREGLQSAKQSVSVMLLRTHYNGYLTMPLKDATSAVHYLGE